MRSGRARRLSQSWDLLGVAGGALFGIALIAFVIVADATLVVRAYERSGSSVLPAIAGGTAAAIATVLAFAWYRRRFVHLDRGARRRLGRAGMAWGALFVVAFLFTHPRGRDEGDAAALGEVALLTYVLLILVAAVGVLPFALRGLSSAAR